MSDILGFETLSGDLVQGPVTLGDYVVSVEDIENGHRVIITKGSSSQAIDLTNGQPGTPGTPGTPGRNGTSPTVSVAEIEGGHRVTITDVTGPHVFDVMNGEDAEDAVVSVNGKVGSVQLNASDVGALPESTAIPTKTSDLTNDSNFITSDDIPAESDPTVPAWAKQTTKPSYTATEVGALPATTKLADMASDTGHRTVSDAEKIVWNAKQAAISDLDDIRAGAEAGATAVQDSDLAAVAKSGSYEDLADTPDIPSAVTEQTVAGWGFTKTSGTYSKPSGGIPSSDMTSEVQASLSKANSALQGTDTTLAISGKAADAKATGDALDEVKDALSEKVFIVTFTENNGKWTADKTIDEIINACEHGANCIAELNYSSDGFIEKYHAPLTYYYQEDDYLEVEFSMNSLGYGQVIAMRKDNGVTIIDETYFDFSEEIDGAISAAIADVDTLLGSGVIE